MRRRSLSRSDEVSDLLKLSVTFRFLPLNPHLLARHPVCFEVHREDGLVLRREPAAADLGVAEQASVEVAGEEWRVHLLSRAYCGGSGEKKGDRVK